MGKFDEAAKVPVQNESIRNWIQRQVSNPLLMSEDPSYELPEIESPEQEGLSQWPEEGTPQAPPSEDLIAKQQQQQANSSTPLARVENCLPYSIKGQNLITPQNVTQVNFELLHEQDITTQFPGAQSVKMPAFEPGIERNQTGEPLSSKLLQYRGAFLEPLKVSSNKDLKAGDVTLGSQQQCLQTPISRSSAFSQILKVQDIKTKDLLSSMVGQQVAEIERFKTEIGGEKAMESYIAQFAQEWRSGSINRQMQGVRERPWSVLKHKKTAYELMQERYSKYKATINLLVENYLNRKSQTNSRSIHRTDWKVQHSDSNSESASDHDGESRKNSPKKISSQGFDLLSSLQYQSQSISTPSRMPSAKLLMAKSGGLTATKKSFFNQSFYPVKEIGEPQEADSVRERKVEKSPQRQNPVVQEVLVENGLHFKSCTGTDKKQGDGLFYIDDFKQKEIFAGLERQIEAIERITTGNVAPNLTRDQTIDSQTPNTLKPHGNLASNFQKQLLKLLEENNGRDIQYEHWLQTLFDEISVSETIQGLLAFRLGALQSSNEKEISEALGQGKQPLGSVLTLIREEFAKFQNYNGGQENHSETPGMSHNKLLSQSEFFQKSQISGRYKQGRYVMLSKMLSKLNYFSHFDSITRQKLIEISKHQITRAGSQVITSDEMAGKILVVISGAVSVHLKNRKRPDDFEMVRHTMYPGDSIGDAPLRLILTDDDLYFFLKASVDSDVLLIRKDEIPRILENEIKDLLDNKIMPLQKCALFAGADHQSPYTIFVLANLVQIRRYQYGEVIQRQGCQAGDSLFLVVKGYCRTVYESTLLRLKTKPPLARFCNSKEVYGEIGVVQRDLASINPQHTVKNINKRMASKLKKMEPGYLPDVPKPAQSQSTDESSSPHGGSPIGNTSTKICAVDFSQQVKDPHCELSQTKLPAVMMEQQQFPTDDITACMMFNEFSNDQTNDLPSTTRDESDQAEKSVEMTTNRTEKMLDRQELIGHMGPNIMESSFELKEKKIRVMKNQVTQVAKNAAQLKKALPETNFTLDKAQIMQIKDHTKLTTHLDLISHRNFIGKNNMICERALLDKDRSIKNLGLELEDFRRALRQDSPTVTVRATAKEKPEQPCLFGNHNTYKNESAQETFMKEMDKRLSKAADETATLRKESKLSIKTTQSKNKHVKSRSNVGTSKDLTKFIDGEMKNNADEQDASSERSQSGGEPRDPVWGSIFTNLRQLMGDQEVRNSTPEKLFDFLNSSQLTVVADSSDLVLLQIRQQDLNQLSEPVRRRIEREIKSQLFVNTDRPFTTKEEFDQFVRAHREEYKRQQSVSEQIHQDPKQKVSLKLTKEMRNTISERQKQAKIKNQRLKQILRANPEMF